MVVINLHKNSRTEIKKNIKFSSSKAKAIKVNILNLAFDFEVIFSFCNI